MRSFPYEVARWFQPAGPSERLNKVRRRSCGPVADLADQALRGTPFSAYPHEPPRLIALTPCAFTEEASASERPISPAGGKSAKLASAQQRPHRTAAWFQ